MEGYLLMSPKELQRKSVLEQVQQDVLSLWEAAEQLGLSYRQMRRAYKRFREFGDAGLVHRSRGRASNRRKDARLREKALKIYRERYEDLEMGPTLAAEKLAEQGLDLDHETLRRWLVEEGAWKRRRRRAKHRGRRERRARFGELVQLDGSHHRWFGPDREQCCLMNLVDDARGQTLSLMAEEETTEAAMRVLWMWIERYGVPRALYLDRKSVYLAQREPTPEEQLAGETPLTEFGKACARLGIALITAHSPQAKGRVERSHGVYQDRLCKELALRGIKRIATANKLLQNGFIEQLNAKFAKAPADPRDAHQPLAPGTRLEHVFCFEETRQVQNDYSISYRGRHYQIAAQNKKLPRPKDKVTVRTLLDGQRQILWRGSALTHHPLPSPKPPRQNSKPTPQPKPQSKASAKAKPPARNHPWRHGCTLMLNEPVPEAAKR